MSIRKSDRIISVEHVSKYFGEKAVLNDVNILGAQHDIYRHLLPESLIHALELMTGERNFLPPRSRRK